MKTIFGNFEKKIKFYQKVADASHENIANRSFDSINFAAAYNLTSEEVPGPLVPIK